MRTFIALCSALHSTDWTFQQGRVHKCTFQYDTAPGSHHAVCVAAFSMHFSFSIMHCAVCSAVLCALQQSQGGIVGPNQAVHGGRALGIRSPRTVIRYLLLLQTSALFSNYFLTFPMQGGGVSDLLGVICYLLLLPTNQESYLIKPIAEFKSI